MNPKNPFRRRSTNRTDDNPGLAPDLRPWWAWGPLGFFWFSGHAGGSSVDPGHMPHHGDGGHINHNFDGGSGFGGFDGGAGGGI